MDISPKHDAARLDAARLPALTASLALLIEDTQRARIELYGAPIPAAPGDAPDTAPLLATITLAATPGTVDAETLTLTLNAPIEGQVTGAAEDTGTAIAWARVFDGAGDWWKDSLVTLTDGDGEIQLDSLTALNGAFIRLTSAVFEG